MYQSIFIFSNKVDLSQATSVLISRKRLRWNIWFDFKSYVPSKCCLLHFAFVFLKFSTQFPLLPVMSPPFVKNCKTLTFWRHIHFAVRGNNNDVTFLYSKYVLKMLVSAMRCLKQISILPIHLDDFYSLFSWMNYNRLRGRGSEKGQKVL